MTQVTVRGTTIPERIYAWHESREDGLNRPHLGASLIGAECERYLWLTFRWASPPSFEGRILRLFKRGFLEEKILEEELKGIGVSIHTHDEKSGRQFNFSALNGHFSGSCDGIATGIIEAPKTAHLVEIKTSNDRQFKLLERDGVEAAKPQHYAQMQVYMKAFKLDRALYIAVNKNDDNIYTERIGYVAKVANALNKRAEGIITAGRPAEILPDSKTGCGWCDYHDLCHGNRGPAVNCRTCAHSTPQIKEGEEPWICEKYSNAPLSIEAQRMGGECPAHIFIPDLLHRYTVVDAGEDWVKYKTPGGDEFVNGKLSDGSEGNVFASVEIAHIMNSGGDGFSVVSEIKTTIEDAYVVDGRGIRTIKEGADLPF